MDARLGRLQRAVDFERVLQQRSRARSHWFALHHCLGRPTAPGPRNLSTDCAQDSHRVVDESTGTTHWLGFVIPKRLARRAVTRNLIRRMGRQDFAHWLAPPPPAEPGADPLPHGLWVLRLKAPIDRQQFVSADSQALRQALHADLLSLWRRAQTGRRAQPSESPS
ncbi:ribonuclease P protein component [Inhella gelatinilytica]|uniref:Ribonuclease P protein component n=1 Tax=Inhella gelatinilytica TaxID=2795030 RepID=A0A931ITN7_9BURK|nr:ribonuclease P protein component [Inhella gelatinilytica]MBH9551757.1 ribonuclease P protein component [Inhella gelatinilytica]